MLYWHTRIFHQGTNIFHQDNSIIMTLCEFTWRVQFDIYTHQWECIKIMNMIISLYDRIASTDHIVVIHSKFHHPGERVQWNDLREDHKTGTHIDTYRHVQWTSHGICCEWIVTNDHSNEHPDCCLADAVVWRVSASCALPEMPPVPIRSGAYYIPVLWATYEWTQY